jgi:probable HAF family extracellular repeat protein
MGVSLAVLSLAPKQVDASAMFIGLDDPPGGAYESEAYGVSGDGTTPVGDGGGYGAFRWTPATGMTGLGDLNIARAASGDGTVIVGDVPSGHAAYWFESNVFDLGELATHSGGSSAYGISADGSTIVGSSGCCYSSEAFRWTRSTGMIGLGDLPGGGFFSQARAISADGSTIVGSGDYGDPLLNEYEAFRWTESSGIESLGDLPGGPRTSAALGVSADGSVIVGASWSNLGNEAFRWTQADGMVGLGHLPGGSHSGAEAVSGDGSRVVGNATSPRGLVAFLWDPVNGMRDLNTVLEEQGVDLSGWRLYRAYGISADGRAIVGGGINPRGKSEAWLAVLPEPPPSLFIVVSLLAATTRRYRLRSRPMACLRAESICAVIALTLSTAGSAGAGVLPVEDRRYVRAECFHCSGFTDYESPLSPFSEFHGSASAFVGDAWQNSRLTALSMSGDGHVWTDGGGGVRGDTTFEVVFQVSEALSYSFLGTLASGWSYVGQYEGYFVDTPEERNASLMDSRGDLFRTSEKSFSDSGVLLPGETYIVSVWTRTAGHDFHAADWTFDLKMQALPEPTSTILIAGVLAAMGGIRRGLRASGTLRGSG